MVQNYDNSEKNCEQRFWGGSLIFLTGGFYLLGTTLFINSYSNYTSSGLIIVGIVLSIGISVLSLFYGKSLFVSAITFAYSSIIMWAALITQPDYYENVHSSSYIMKVDLLLALVSLFYESMLTITPDEESNTSTPIKKINSAVAETVDQSEKDSSNIHYEEPTEISMASAIFNLMMALASLYYAMIITNWGHPDINNNTTDFLMESNKLGMWAKIIIQWLLCLLFGWSIIAPTVLKERDF